MAKLPPYNVDKFKKILKANGYSRDRCNGGHEIWEKTITDSVSIPVHSDINGAMAKRLIKEHNLKEAK